jgi:hypothetical protein
MRVTLAVLLLAAGTTAAAAAEPKLPQLNLTYAASWKGITLGEIVITLKPEGGADCYRYQSVTHPVGLVRMFYGSPSETSEFCLANGRVVPKKFAFSNPKDASDSFQLEFDSAAGKVRDGRGTEREIPANAQDRFGMQQAVRQWVLAHLKHEPGAETVEFTMVDDRRIKAYRFAITGREDIQIPAGKFSTIVVQRVDNPNRSSKFWIAPERDYMPVRVEQTRNGSLELRMELRR